MLLTDEEVRELRQRRAAGELVKDLAAAYGLPIQTVSALTTGRRRPDAGGPLSAATRIGGPLKLTRAKLRLVKQALADGLTYKEAGALLGISAAAISKALNGKTLGND